MNFLKYILLLIIITFSACNKLFENDWEIPYGSWKFHQEQDDVIIFQLTDSFAIDEGGFTINANNELIYRSFGWCGTPPLIYSDFEGVWIELDEKILKMNYLEYNQNVEWVMEVVEHQQNFLTVINHYDWE